VLSKQQGSLFFFSTLFLFEEKQWNVEFLINYYE
tara:strand:- start:14 stop:115 length:102 start_codon:yes stop_codon:yes gene_type:complete